MSNSKHALIIVDAQNDFMPGGALAVGGGHVILPAILSCIGRFDVVVTSQDWHPPDHSSFSDAPKYQDKSWPSHCVQYTPGAQIHHEIRRVLSEKPPQTLLRVFKGDIADREAYSAFEGYVFDWEKEGDFISKRKTERGYSEVDRNLAERLKSLGVTNVYVCGLATDYCVKATCLDAIKNGFHTFLISDSCAGVAEESSAAATKEMDDAGVLMTFSFASPEPG